MERFKMGTVDDQIYEKKIDSDNFLMIHTYWESWTPGKIKAMIALIGEEGYSEVLYSKTIFSKDGGEPSDNYIKKIMMPKFNKYFTIWKKKLNKKKK